MATLTGKPRLTFPNGDISPASRKIPYAPSAEDEISRKHVRRHFLDSPTVGSLFLPNPVFHDEVGLLRLLDNLLNGVKLSDYRRPLDLLPDCVRIELPGVVLGESALTEIIPDEPVEILLRDPGTEWEVEVKTVSRPRRICEWILVIPRIAPDSRNWHVQTAYPGDPAVMLPTSRFRQGVQKGEFTAECLHNAESFWERHGFCALPSPERERQISSRGRQR